MGETVRISLSFFLLFVLVVITTAALGHDHAAPALDKWYQSLRSGKGPCCDGPSVDALKVEDADWESRNGHYRVRLNREWVDVPDDAVVKEPNRAGPTIVWPYYLNGEPTGVRCFMPGVMT